MVNVAYDRLEELFASVDNADHVYAWYLARGLGWSDWKIFCVVLAFMRRKMLNNLGGYAHVEVGAFRIYSMDTFSSDGNGYVSGVMRVNMKEGEEYVHVDTADCTILDLYSKVKDKIKGI